MDGLPGDVSGAVAGQESYHLRHLPRLSHTPERHLLEQSIPGFAGDGGGHVRLDQPRRHRVDQDVPVRQLSRGPRSVIALGGGAVTQRAVRLAVRKTGHLVWLRAPIEVLAARLGDASSRPLLAGDPRGRLAGLSAQREPIYARLSDATLDVMDLSPTQLAASLAALVERLEAERAHG